MSAPLVNITPLTRRGGSRKAKEFFAASAPRSPQIHLFETAQNGYALLVNGTRVYQLETEIFAALQRAVSTCVDVAADEILASYGLDAAPYIDDAPPTAPPVRALSLAVAQKCNLGCTYCYAQEGNFGGAAKEMSAEVATRAVELLFSDVKPGERVNLSFLGGEPLTNRGVLRRATEMAVGVAQSKGAHISFSITTNGTLLTPADGEFFEEHGFAVTVSLDGVRETHDRLRPFKSGRGSYDRVIANVTPLLALQRHMQVSARVTVTPQNLRLSETLDQLIGLGFHSVGFSPMLSSPTGRDQMNSPELELMLEQMIECGEKFERQTVAGRRYPFSNMVNAMREIHKGTHRPFPCGAGASYLGVSAEGQLFACHRFVDDERGALGDIAIGVNQGLQEKWLDERHVHRQEPCRSCWARYMCGGGCHHEVINRGRPACDYVRGWLHYCLQAYVRLSGQRPDYFGSSSSA
jgi:uncharacterized protein